MALIGDNQTVSRGVYGMSIRNVLNIPEDFIVAQADRINRAYDNGEPLWMIADELRIRFVHRPQRTNPPGALAVRRVRISR